MTAPLHPSSPEELVDAVRSVSRLIPVGAGTKPGLSAVAAVRLSTAALRGIVEYEPDEFTFTARAGTPVRELAAALAERGQYLPFDPLLGAAGATLGGTVASGLNGPGRFRYGGLRDFILGVRFVDGAGRLLRLGGKVVKNAAGFDLPKFFVGSLGRFGVLADLTFKVFPRPATRLTVRLVAADDAALAQLLEAAAGARWELDALEALPRERTVLLRLAGPAPALGSLADEIIARWGGERMTEDAAEKFWEEPAAFGWADPHGPLLKVALSPAALPLFARLVRELPGAEARVGQGGNVAYLSLAAGADVPALGGRLRGLGLPALTLRGPGPLRPGAPAEPAIARAVKLALDPEDRFPPLDE